MDDLRNYVIEGNSHIIGLVTTWLHDGNLDGEVSILGFTGVYQLQEKYKCI
jgi:hypothetical protein